MYSLYEINVNREIEYVRLREQIETDFWGSKQASTYKQAFLSAFNAEHKVFVALKNDANARQADYDAHFRKMQEIVDKYMRIYSTEFNGGINAYHLSKAEAQRHVNIVEAKLDELDQKIRQFHQVLLKAGHGNYFYYNADSLQKEIDNEKKEILYYEFCRIKETDTRGYAMYVRKIYEHYNSLDARFRLIKANAPSHLF